MSLPLHSHRAQSRLKPGEPLRFTYRDFHSYDPDGPWFQIGNSGLSAAFVGDGGLHTVSWDGDQYIFSSGRSECYDYSGGTGIGLEMWDVDSDDPNLDHSYWFQYAGTWYAQAHQDGLGNCEVCCETAILGILEWTDYDLQELTD